MKTLRDWFNNGPRFHARDLKMSVAAWRESRRFDPGAWGALQFLRIANYRTLSAELKRRYGTGAGLVGVEFGGSENTIPPMLPDAEFTLAPNFPECDVHDLSAWPEAHYDLVIVEQVLEHLADPARAVEQLRLRLKPGGLLIATTPFLIRIHGYPHDFQRWTPAGLKREFAAFREVDVHTWGSKHALRTIIKYGWVSADRAKALGVADLRNDPEWPIDCLTLATR
jgi:SAM-dependent methyltransferase